MHYNYFNNYFFTDISHCCNTDNLFKKEKKEQVSSTPEKQETELEVKIIPTDNIIGTNIQLSSEIEVRIIKSYGDPEIDSYKAKIMKEAAELETNPNRALLVNNKMISNFQVHLGNIYGNEGINNYNYGDYHNLIVKYTNGQQINNEVLEVASNHRPNKDRFYVKNA